MYQYEKRLDCRALGKEIKRRRKAKDWTQEHLTQLVDLTPRSIMYIENRGQHTILNAFYKLVTLLDIFVDEFFYPDRHNGENEHRKYLPPSWSAPPARYSRSAHALEGIGGRRPSVSGCRPWPTAHRLGLCLGAFSPVCRSAD